MPFGHLYIDAEQGAVLEALERCLRARGFARADMRPDLHPRRMKQAQESRTRLFWISPRLARWTGVFEFRYYNNEMRERWGLTDERLAECLSQELAVRVWRLEVVDNAGFWLYSRLDGGKETEGGAYQDAPGRRSADPAHPRYALNRIVEREGFRNIGLGYENIPGPQVCPIEGVPQSAQGIDGYAEFVHRAFAERSEGPTPPSLP
ncbi:MAG: hypothetical protein HYY16_10915 [Planctomycetes bacterium]|nr:hypothetical protein [Planctomycetota bacterium]